MPRYERAETRSFSIVDASGNRQIVIATRTVSFVGNIGGGLENATEWIFQTAEGVPVKLNWPDNSYCIVGDDAVFTTMDPNAPSDPLNGYRI